MSLQILLIDDDPVFCRLLQKTAQSLGTSLTVETDAKADPRLFDVAIIDQNLGDTLGVDVSRMLDRIPVVLISSDRKFLEEQENCPPCIRYFVDKRHGMLTILSAALAAARSPSRAALN